MKNFFVNVWNKIKQNWIVITIILSLILLDQVLKLFFDNKAISVIDKVFSFTSLHNTGAGWGILSGKIWLLIIFSIIFMILIFIFNHFQKNKTKLYNISFALIIAGAIGNLIDRAFLGYVRDFLYVELINFPIFNFADSCLTIGVILLCIFLLFFDKKEPKKVYNENENSKEIIEKEYTNKEENTQSEMNNEKTKNDSIKEINNEETKVVKNNKKNKK